MSLAPRVRHGIVDSPFGPLFIATSDTGVLRVGFPEERIDALMEEIEGLAAGRSTRVAPGAMSAEKREFDGYFEGRSREMALQADLALAPPGFARRVLLATARIPYGSVSTYGDVARRASSRRAARAAGNALNRNPVPILIPCHRVVPASGAIGGYGGREDRKVFLLDLEGTIGVASPEAAS